MSDEADEQMEHRNALTRLWWRVDALLTQLKAYMTGTATPTTQTDSSRCTDASVKGTDSAHVNSVRIEITDRTLAVLALVVAVLVLGMLFERQRGESATALLQEQLVNAKIQAGTAKAEAISNAAKVDARVALDKVEDFRAKLAAKGIDVPPLDGH